MNKKFEKMVSEEEICNVKLPKLIGNKKDVYITKNDTN